MPNLTPLTITTSRLVLRPLLETDADALFTIFSDPTVMRYWSTAPWSGIAQAHAWIEQAVAGWESGTAARFGVVLAETGELVGYCNLYSFSDSNRRCDIGYALAQAHWGKGYLPEALAGMIDYGFRALDLNRIEADIDPRNEASAKVLERLGFQKEGFMPERWIVNGEICDTTFYGLLRRGWEAR